MKAHHYKCLQQYSKLLLDTKAVDLIGSIYNEDREVLRGIHARLRQKIKRWVRAEGLENLCSRIKTAEKQFLLTGQSNWTGLRHFGLGTLSDNSVKTLLSIHRNMKCKVDPDLSSIEHIGTKQKDFYNCKEYQGQMEKLLSSRIFKAPTG